MKGIINVFAIILVLVVGSSCNRDFPNTLQKDFKNDTAGVTPKEAKILYIILDGTRGRALRTLNTPNLTEIYKKSIYAFDALADFEGTDMTNAGGWTNMLTGVNRTKHGVVTEDFAGNKLAQFPGLFSRIKENSNGKMRTAAFSASAAFSAHLTVDATESKTFDGNDLAVKNALVNELENPEATVVLGQFHAVEAAGQQFGYSETTAGYANAILQMDTYIGEIMKALRARKTFAAENWLVVIASNKGGSIPPDPANTDQSFYADGTRNSFVVFYNPRFNTQFVPKPDVNNIPYTSSGVKNFNDQSYSAITDDPSLYNFGASGDYTVSFKFKSKGAIKASWPALFSKKASGGAADKGWHIFNGGGGWQIRFEGTSGFVSFDTDKAITDGLWHAITFKIYAEGAKRWVSTFTDGELRKKVDITNVGNLNSPSPLRIGQFAGDAKVLSTVVTDIEIFNVALSDATIQKYSRNTYLDPAHPNINNIIGYWPGDDGKGSRIKEVTGKGKDFITYGAYQWESFSDISPNINPPIKDSFYQVVPNNVDIPFQIYQWMGFSTPASLGLDGKMWKTTYNDVKLPY